MRSIEEKRIQILTLLQEGWGPSQISRKLKVARNTVRLWAARANVEDKPRSGRPTVLSPTTKSQITKNIKQKIGGSTRKALKRLNESKRYQQKGKKISRTTVRNYIKSQPWGRTAYKRPVKQLLSAKNVQDRLKFGEMLKKTGFLEAGKRGQQKRSHVLYTDETWLEESPKGNRQTQRYYTEDPTKIPQVMVPKFGLKVMVAGGFCAQGVTKLHMVEDGTVNAKYYKEKILPLYMQSMEDQRLFPNSRKVTFQQDGATPHTAKIVSTVLEELSVEVWGKGVWPGNSPDLNPIEIYGLFSRIQPTDHHFRRPSWIYSKDSNESGINSNPPCSKNWPSQ
ncbi:Transposable element Tc3 transposase [Folsomia candida]|uniref:Transposable element Tc3 transposase n=1 Tax=Folsomia candida TaxID=158441 RepID=A0A226D9Y9_FOLCA|nr:Transposable element Tc3 transposase [Folsomia candida]